MFMSSLKCYRNIEMVLNKAQGQIDLCMYMLEPIQQTV
jgi:hypothetical protein